MDSNEQRVPEEFELKDPALFATFITLVLFLGIVANILAVVATRRSIKINQDSRRSRKITIATFLIHCLMAVDLFSVIFFFFRGMFTPLYRSTWLRCDFDNASNLFLSWLAGLINALMCFERCIAMTAPFYYHSKASVGKAKIAVAVVVVIAFVFSMLPIVGFGSYRIDINGTYYCIGPGDIGFDVTEYDFHYTILFLITGVSIVLFIQTCNAIVVSKIMEIHKRARTMRQTMTRHATGRLGSSSSGRGPTHASGVTDDSLPSAKSRSSRILRTLMRASVGNDDTTTSSSTSEDRGGDDQNGHRRRRIKRPGKTEINIAKQIVVVSVVFSLSWLPFYVSDYIYLSSSSSSS